MKTIKNNLLIVLLSLGIFLLVVLMFLYTQKKAATWGTELAKGLMGLSFTVIFGRVIPGPEKNIV